MLNIVTFVYIIFSIFILLLMRRRFFENSVDHENVLLMHFDGNIDTRGG